MVHRTQCRFKSSSNDWQITWIKVATMIGMKKTVIIRQRSSGAVTLGCCLKQFFADMKHRFSRPTKLCRCQKICVLFKRLKKIFVYSIRQITIYPIKQHSVFTLTKQ